MNAARVRGKSLRMRISREAKHELIGRLICVAVLAATIWLTHGGARAALTGACTVPDYLLSSDYRLRRVTAAVEKQKALRIAVVGTGSSALAGPAGPSSAYPARLEAALVARFPGVDVKVVTLVRTRLTAARSCPQHGQSRR